MATDAGLEFKVSDSTTCGRPSLSTHIHAARALPLDTGDVLIRLAASRGSRDKDLNTARTTSAAVASFN
jgi:hypothetical protein